MSEVNHLPQLISDLAYILIIAAPATLFFKRIKQPIVLGYILAGFFVGPHFSFSPTVIDLAGIKVWAEIGVIFLLFSLGLEFSLKKLMSVGKSAGITALLEVPFMLLCGYLLGRAFGWTKIDSLFLGGIISISSTTIIIRAFDELGFKSRKFVGQVFGILIIEDLFAILLLVLLSMLSVTNVFSGVELVSTVVKLGFFLVAWFVAGLYLIPISLEKVRSLMNEETTLILAVGFCLLMVMLATSAGYSPALGAFVMGSILGETRHVKSIEHVFKPVKNIFSAIFFVSVGMLIDPAIILNNFHLILIVFFVTILGKFFSNFFGSLIAGQGIKNSIQTGMSLANIGEFSFIIATLGITLKVTNQVIYPVAVAVSAITVFTTPYQIKYSERLFNWVESHLSLELLKRLNNYQYAMRHGNPESALFVLFKRSSLKIIINIVIVTAIAVVSKKYLLPMTY